MRIDLHTDPAIRAVARPRRESRPWLQLVSAVLCLAGEHVQLLSHAETPWASLTFTGTRHVVRLRFVGGPALEAAETFIATLPDHEFTLSRRLVADATIESVDQRQVPTPELVLDAVLLLVDADGE